MPFCFCLFAMELSLVVVILTFHVLLVNIEKLPIGVSVPVGVCYLTPRPLLKNTLSFCHRLSVYLARRHGDHRLLTSLNSLTDLYLLF